MRVLVTGATGSLGSAVVQRLSENGHTVTGLGRSLAKIKRLKERGFNVEQCNLLDQASLNQQVAGHDVIVHCAAFAAPFGRKRTFFETNVEGFNHLLQSVAANEVGRLVVVSSASVFDGNDSSTPHSDATPEPHLRPRHPYGASKYDAECLAATMPKHRWIGLRPRAVFGVGDQTLVPRLKRLVSHSRYTVIGKGDALVDVTCLANFLDAVEAALEANEDAMGQFYNISNGDPRRFEDIIKAYGERNGVTLKRRSIPYALVAGIARASVMMASIMPGTPWEPKLTPYGLRQVTQSLRLDISGAKAKLGWEPKISFEQGLEELE